MAISSGQSGRRWSLVRRKVHHFAREGVFRLVKDMDGLQRIFHSVMKVIVDRHAEAVSQVDHTLVE